MERPNHEKIKTFGEKETYWNMGILEVDPIKQPETKEKKLKKKSEYLRRTRKLLETRLC